MGRTNLLLLSYIQCCNLKWKSICSFHMTEDRESRELEVLQQKALSSPPLILEGGSDRGTWRKHQGSGSSSRACAGLTSGPFSSTCPFMQHRTQSPPFLSLSGTGNLDHSLWVFCLMNELLPVPLTGLLITGRHESVPMLLLFTPCHPQCSGSHVVGLQRKGLINYISPSPPPQTS